MPIRAEKFWTQYRTGKPDVDYVEIRIPGDKHTTAVHRVRDIMPPEDIDANSESHQYLMERWQIIGPAYEAWKAGETVPESGTPLAAWAGVSPEQAGVLRSLGIRTVEEVADMNDSMIGQVKFPNARKIPEMARAYLKGKDVALRDAENAALKERLAAMEEVMNEMIAEKRKPGRPKKVEAA